MATRKQVESAIAAQHPDSGVIVCDGRTVPVKKLAEREPANGGGAALVVLDFDADAHGIVPAPTSRRPS
jgi:hypothetical protein